MRRARAGQGAASQRHRENSGSRYGVSPAAPAIRRRHRPGKAGTARSPRQFRARALHQPVKPRCVAVQPLARARGPARVIQRQFPHRQRRARDRPRPQQLAQPRDQLRRADGKAQPQTGETPELAETLQHDHPRRVRMGNQRSFGADIRKTLVDDGQRRAQRLRAMPVAGRIVGIDDDPRRDMTGLGGFRHLPVMRREGGGVFVICGRCDMHPSCSGQRGQPRDQGRRPRCRQDRRAVGHIPMIARGALQRGAGGAVGQRAPGIVGQGWHGVGQRVDPGRKVDPARAHASVARQRRIEPPP